MSPLALNRSTLGALAALLTMPLVQAAQPQPAQTAASLTQPAAIAANPEAPTAMLIRANLRQRMPRLPRIDAITPTPMAGVFEVRVGTQVLYTDAMGDFLIEGNLIDTRSQRNLTQEHIDRLTAIDFAGLPLQDALVRKIGNGQRRIAVFADPNCGYCKRLEAELQKVSNVTVYTFLYPVLGPDSMQKSQAIWCQSDAAAVWHAWMLQATPIPGVVATSASATDAASAAAIAPCPTPLKRNLAFGQAHRIDGTPAIIFEDGSRSPGLMSAAQIEAKLGKGG